MAQGFSAELVGVIDGTQQPARKADGRIYGARVRNYRATLDFAASNTKNAVGDTNVIVRRPYQTAFRRLSVVVSASLGSVTLAIGTAANPTKYMSATTFTTPDTPQAFAKAAAVLEAPLEQNEDVIVTIGGAAATTGVVIVDFETLAR